MSTEAGQGTIFLFQNQTTDANSTAYPISYPNKTTVVKVWGTFGGGTIKLQNLAPQTNPEVWIDIPDMDGTPVTFAGPNPQQFPLEFLIQNEKVRAVLSGSGGTTTLNVSLEIY